MTASRSCPICGHSARGRAFGDSLVGSLVPQGGTMLFVCGNCGLGFLSPQPTEEFLAEAVYNKDYELYETTWRDARPSVPQLAYRAVFPHPLIGLLPKVQGRALDAGCGGGYWMHRLRDLGWDVSGIDFDEGVIEKVRAMGFPAECASIEEALLAKEAYDLVLLSAVLEHLHDPLAALRNAWSALKPGGYMVIDVPNFGSAEVRAFGNDWSLFSIAHLFYFTQNSLGLALEQTGFRPEKFVRRSAELTFGYSLSRKLGTSRGSSVVVLSSPFQLMLNLLNQSGELFCRARKPL